MNEKRTAVRLLQPSEELPGAATCGSASPRGLPPPLALPPQSGATHPPSSARRRSSICTTHAGSDEACAGSGSGACSCCSDPVGATARRAAAAHDGEPAVHLGGTSPAGNCDPEAHHLSVPMTLLSLNNGGGRHTPRFSSRDTSPMVSIAASREGSFNSQPEGLVLTSSCGAGSIGSPPHRIPSGQSSPPTSGPLPTLAVPRPGTVGPGVAAQQPPPSPRDGTALSRHSAELSAGTCTVHGACPTSATAVGGPPNGSGTPSVSSGGGGSGAAAAVAAGGGGGGGGCSGSSGGGGVTLPGHLCSQRPPTPLCKEDDLMASLRHLASPTRRRSRFASAADASLLAAAAAAIAAEEAGLLDSPPDSGGGGGGSVRGSLSLSGESPPRQPLRPLMVAGMEPAPWGAGSPSGNASRHRASIGQLGTVIEEPSVSLGNGAARSAPRPSSSVPGGAAAAGGGAGAGGTTGTAGRRRRGSGSGGCSSADVGTATQDGETGHSAPTRGGGGSAAATTAGAAARAGSVSGGPADDALSSFMHSFGPGSPSARCPTPASGQSVCLPGGGGRITAR